MNVDRTRFLMLTAALSAATAVILSAGGCSSATNSAADAGATETPDSSTSGGNGKTDGGATDGSTDSGVDAGPCLGDSTVEGGFSDCSKNVACEAKCSTVQSGNLRSDVGEAASACIIKLTSPCTEGTIDPGVKGCVEAAVARACPDPTAESTCTPLVAACAADAASAKFTMMQCLAVANGLSAAGRDALTACWAEGCPESPQDCIDKIGQPL